MKKLLLSVFALSAGLAAQAQWTEQATGFSSESRGINEIEILDENTVWCIAYDGIDTANNIQEFTKTTDGGTTWTAGIMDLDGDPTLAINNLSPTSGDVAWLSTINGDLGGGSLYKTEDGGLTWVFSNPPGGYPDSSSFQNTVHFFTPEIGIVQGDPTGPGNGTWEIYRTTDGGQTWSAKLPAVNFTGTVSSGEYGYNSGNVAAGQFFWFVTNKGKLYRTSNQGLNWTKLTATPFSDFGAANVNARVHFSDIDGDITHAVGIMIGTINGSATTPTYTRYTSTDGGSTWTAQAGNYTGLQTIDFIPGTTMLVGNVGAPTYGSSYSSDMGQTWIPIDTGVQRNAIAFLNGSTGWAGSFNLDDTQGGIFKYTGAALAVPSVRPAQQFSATPNPTRGMVQVANDNAAITNVAVYDLLGKQVYKGDFSALNNVNVDLSSLNTGAYILKATSETGATQTIKIVKE